MSASDAYTITEVDLTEERTPGSPEEIDVPEKFLTILRATDPCEVRLGTPKGDRLPAGVQTIRVHDRSVYVTNPPAHRLDANLVLVGHDNPSIATETPDPVHEPITYIDRVTSIGAAGAGDRPTYQLQLDERVVGHIEHLRAEVDTAGEIHVYSRVSAGNVGTGSESTQDTPLRSDYVNDPGSGDPPTPRMTQVTDDSTDLSTPDPDFVRDASAGTPEDLIEGVRGLNLALPDARLDNTDHRFIVAGTAGATLNFVEIRWREALRRPVGQTIPWGG